MKAHAAGDARGGFRTPAVWGGRSQASATHGIHAVTVMEANGARRSICGLVGRFLVDDRLTAMVGAYSEAPLDLRCPSCQQRWADMAGQGSPTSRRP